MKSRRVAPPDIEIDDDGHYDLPCVQCGQPRTLTWGGTVEYAKARKRPCSTCGGNRAILSPAEPDPVTVDLLADGLLRQARVLRSERLLALQKMLCRHPDWKYRMYADRLGVTNRTVDRYVAELRRRAA